LNLLVNAARQSLGVSIVRADDNPVVSVTLVMEANEIDSILSEYDASHSRRVAENDGIFHPLIGPASFLTSDDVVTEPAQRLDDWVSKVLVSVEVGHASRNRVVVDGGGDLLGVLYRVSPSVDQILSSQDGEVVEELGFRGTQVFRFD
jgi:hypothetical protein